MLHVISGALLFPLVSSSSTFYVSSSKGSDSNVGSSTSPWKTLEHAVQGVAPGDSLLLRLGDSWQLAEPLVLTGWGSGVNNASRPPAVLQPYDDGQDNMSTPRPWISRITGNGVGPVVYCADCIGLSISGLEVSGGEQGVLFGYSIPSSNNGGVTVTSCYFHDVRGVRSGGNPMAWGSGIGFNTTARTDVFAVNINISGNVFNSSDVAYQNCITAQTHGACLWPDGGPGGGYVNLDGVVWMNNFVNHVSFNAAIPPYSPLVWARLKSLCFLSCPGR
jgi:hypothetical protein